MKSEKKVIIAHFNTNLSWVNKIDNQINFEIYSTSHKEINSICSSKITFIEPNKGMDANMYLNFIIKNYDNLPDKILFIHHHETNWSHDFPLPHIINNLNWENSDYMNVGCRYCYSNLYDKYPLWVDYLSEIWFLFEEYLPFPKEKLIYYAGTQFMCNKELILQYPKSFYENLYSWLINTNWEDWKSGRVFEYLWHYILTKNPIDREFTNKQIFKSL